jgi:hypothetical protein
MRSVWLVGALILQAARCGPQKPDPEATYRAFAQAANRGDANTAWSLLSKESQAELDREAKAIAAAQPGMKAPDAKILAFGEPLTARPEIKSISVTEDGKGHANLAVTDSGGATHPIVAVLEDGRWRIDLTNELHRSKQ